MFIENEWKEKTHKGFWCLCYDSLTTYNRVVTKAVKNPVDLPALGYPYYLVNPEGERLSN